MRLFVRIWPCLVLALAYVPGASATGQPDPCQGQANKIACIEGLIADLSVAIEARIEYLNSTEGPQGEKGLTGPAGAKGPQGPQGLDMAAIAYQNANARRDALIARYQDDVLRPENRQVNNALNRLQLSVDDIWHRYQSLNRNPGLIGVLGMPYRGGAQLQDYVIDRGGRSCIVRSGGTECGEYDARPDSVVSVCSIFNEHIGGEPASYCNNIITSQTIYTAFATDDSSVIDTGHTKTELEKFLDSGGTLEVLSLDEWASYKLGLDKDDPVFREALEGVLRRLENEDVQAEITMSLNTGLINLVAERDTALAEAASDAERDEINALYDASEQAVLDGGVLISSLSDADWGLRQERLAEYAMDSDLMYFLLVHSAIDNYIRYLNNDSAYISSLTVEELEAFELFDRKFLVFAQRFVQRWKDAAGDLRAEFFLRYPVKYTFGWPNTPNFVVEAAAQMAERYDFQQSPEVESLALEYAAIGANTLSFAGTAAAFAVATSAKIAGAGFKVYPLTMALLGKGTAIGGSVGAASVAAGPVAILVGAAVNAVVTTIALVDQSRKDKQFDALMAWTIDTPQDLLDMTYGVGDDRVYGEDILANMLYAWLMIDNPRAVSNNEDL